jgi:hypothetical protein
VSIAFFDVISVALFEYAVYNDARIAGVHSTEQSEGIMKSSIYYRKDL